MNATERWYDWRPTRLSEWIAFWVALWFIAIVVVTVVTWIYNGNVYLEWGGP